jgi:tRNA (guanosine-2'-O-)-methyltransferase
MAAEVKMSPQRYARIRQLLRLRQPSLTLCLEQVHKPHNVSAIVRSCDAVGVHEIHAVWDKKTKMRKSTAMGSQNWVYTQVHPTIEEAIGQLKAQKMQVLVTNLSDQAVDFREIDYSQPTAIILGQEKHGATEQAIAMADTDIIIPMVGMVQSLNVSVAAALILYEAQRQRTSSGMYEQQQLSEQACQKMLFEGGFPILRDICDRKSMTYPYINEEGHIEADQDWWQELQMTKKGHRQMLANQD